jgi:hypothetical protein
MTFPAKLSGLLALAAFAAFAALPAAAQPGAAHSTTVQYKGLPHQCSVTAWENFMFPPNGHQPWHFTMDYGAGTSCQGGGGLKFLTVWVEWKYQHSTTWTGVTNPSTNRIAQPTDKNPLRVSTAWTALPKTPLGVQYRVVAYGVITYQNNPRIPPIIIKGLAAQTDAITPATAP